MQEAIKNYPPVAIVKAVKEYANNELDLGESVKDLKRKEVANIKYKLHGPLETHLVDNIELESDILETISYLKNQEYYCERYYISQKSTYGIVFAHPKQLKKLHQYGWLTLIDSTHKTNKHDWRLFTLYIRDSYNCWDVGAHFFVSNEDSDTITEALKIIRNICKNWIPGYVFMDQSNIETNSIKKVFPGLKAGENECRIILCTVHIVRTWIAKIYEKKTREIMIGAMHKRTKIGCEQFIQNAIQQCSVSAVCNFIKRNYMKNSHKWALWARQHSPLLLQVTSTNALESYHSELKRTTSFLYGLIGASYKIVALDQKKRAESENTAFNFRTKKISAYGVDDEFLEEIHKFPFPNSHKWALWARQHSPLLLQVTSTNALESYHSELKRTTSFLYGLIAYGMNDEFLEEIHKFPFPVQQMLIKEIGAVMDRLEKGKCIPGLTSLECHCLFHNRYLLPCKYIFHEHMELVIEEIPIQTDVEKKIENRRHTVNELTERVRNKYWSAEEMGASQVEIFVNKLEISLNSIINIIHKNQ
ncbi:hypothetical protein Glove_468g3 [Diversispora epigaea]|uniref:ZSWIM1/3 RNaseH-like domain-containing protein n=1 Tax=Diversispora epigaea TaxID=1348612 RepID=A0A397GR18_9GLOM|nr:hypothetical protein Glove_468g3 [Diversispora epigaea]